MRLDAREALMAPRSRPAQKTKKTAELEDALETLELALLSGNRGSALSAVDRRRVEVALALLADDEVDDGFDDLDGEYEEDEEDVSGGWWPGRSWHDYKPTSPIRIEGGLTAKSRRGAIGESWWSKRFLLALEHSGLAARASRGRSYARQGQVIDLSIFQGLIEARVQGSRPMPYVVRVSASVVDEQSWDRVAEALVAHAGVSAQMLAGEMPHEIEEVFTSQKVALFPSSARDLKTDCTCPDWANPCKHVAAVCYLVAEAFDRDPFLLLAWRGRDRETLLAHLRELRGGAPVGDSDKHADIAEETVDLAPLAECVVGFWKAGRELSELRIWPKASEVPGALLRQMPRGILEVRGRDVEEALRPAYEKMAQAAQKRAFQATATL